MMESSQIEPAKTSKLLTTHSLRVWILGASVIVLAAGAWLRPRAERTPLSPPAEQSAPLIEEQVERREGMRTLRNVQDVALRARNYGVAILSARRDTAAVQAAELSEVAGFGVVLSETSVLTHALALSHQSQPRILTNDNTILDAQVLRHDSLSGLVLVQTARAAGTAARVARESPLAGTLVVAVGRSVGRDRVVPVFITSVGRDHYTLGPVTASVLPGMPFYNLDGELLAIAARDSAEIVAIPVSGGSAEILTRAPASP
jgi:hypothetical protein